MSLQCTTSGVGVSLNAAGTVNVDSAGAPGGSFVIATGNTAISSMATALGVNLLSMNGASASFINNSGTANLGGGGLTGIAGATFNVNMGAAFHKRNAMKKLNVRTTAQLIKYALKHRPSILT